MPLSALPFLDYAPNSPARLLKNDGFVDVFILISKRASCPEREMPVI
jgi:hypothetical protein